MLGAGVMAGVSAWLVLGVQPAWAWGKDGHVIVARIAQQYLNAKARAGIHELIGDRSIGESRIANWPDLIRGSSFFRKKYPNNASFHFVDLPLDGADEAAEKFAKDPNCILGALKRFSDVLRDPKATEANRREALFFLVHLVGDLHQPLHCAAFNRDRGGNRRRVHLPGDDIHASNLHRVWDTTLVEEAMRGLELDDYVTRLVGRIDKPQRDDWQTGDPKAWALETNKIAKDKAYAGIGATDGLKGAVIVLKPAYLTSNADIVETQLKKAGVRLARMLNEAFD
jgi:hypothetical protein